MTELQPVSNIEVPNSKPISVFISKISLEDGCAIRPGERGFSRIGRETMLCRGPQRTSSQYADRTKIDRTAYLVCKEFPAMARMHALAAPARSGPDSHNVFRYSSSASLSFAVSSTPNSCPWLPPLLDAVSS